MCKYMTAKQDSSLEMPGIEPGAFHMQSERATTALHPLVENRYFQNILILVYKKTSLSIVNILHFSRHFLLLTSNKLRLQPQPYMKYSLLKVDSARV